MRHKPVAYIRFPDSNPFPVIEMTATGKVTYMNRAARRHFPFLDSTPLDEDWARAIGDARSDTNRMVQREVCVKKVWLQLVFIWVWPIRRARIFGMDITERKEVERELKQERNKLYIAFQKTRAVLMINHVPEGTIVDVNEAWEREFGYSKEEAVGRTTEEVRIWEKQENRARILDRFKKEPMPVTFEAGFVTKDGKPWTAIAHTEIVYLEGEPHTLTSMHNIVKIRMAEATAEDVT